MALIDYLESMDFVTLRQYMLEMAPDDVDASEGSFLYDAVTPIAMFVSEMFSQMKLILEQSFIGTATGSNLDTLAATMPRIYRNQAMPERLTLQLVPKTNYIIAYLVSNQNTLRFSNVDGEFYNINVDQTEWLRWDQNSVFVNVVKSVGGSGTAVVGNTLEPSPAIDGLASCTVKSIDARGQDEEDDDHFRVRVWATLSSPFLGSMADYQRKIFSDFPLSENGFKISNCFIIPRGSRSGYICVIPAKLGDDGSTSHCESGELESLQNYLDRRVNGIGGYGMGVAPIGHVVKVRDFSEFKLHQKVTITVARGHLQDVSNDSAEEQVIYSTNGYLHDIINEVVPSSSNYMQNTNRYVNFFIYYYVNANEFAVLSALKAAFGDGIIKNVLIERRAKMELGDFSQDSEQNVVSLPNGSTAINNCYLNGEQIFMNNTDWSLSELSVTSESFPSIMDYISLTINPFDSALIMERNGNYSGSLLLIRDCKLVRTVATPQTDLVIKSGDSKGTLPVLGELEVIVAEEE